MMKQILRLRNELTVLSLSALLLATQEVNAQQVISNNQTGTQDGWYWSFWKDNGNASMTLYPGGRYTTTWNGVNNFTAGKGWAVGKADRQICFSGSFNGGNNGFLAVYGWTKNPLIEYYVIENHGSWTPPGNYTSKGTYTSDDGTYNIYETTRTNQPSIIGTATFQQYWSVRTSKRASGTVTFANHVAAWNAKGMKLGTTWDYQIIESEGYQSTGSSDITIKECNSCATAAPTAKLTYTYEVGDVATPLTATGTALKWYAESGSTTALPSAPTPSTAKVGVTKYYVGQTLNGCEGARAEITVTVAQTYKIYKVSSPLTIDGIIEDAWNDANVKAMNAGTTLTGTISNAADLSGAAKMLWDNNYLYVLAEVKDESKKNDSPNGYDDDAVEVYVDINNDKASTYGTNDFQYTFGWNDGTTVGVLPSGASTTGVTYSAVSTSNGYLIEARIPWSTVKGSPTADQAIGIDFMVNDDDDGTGRDAKIAWNSTTDNAYKDASLFGTAKLSNQQVVTEIAEAFAIANGSVYPNPATNELYLVGFHGDSEYTLADYAGRTILTGQHSEKIDLTSLEAGVYIITVKQGERVKRTKITKL